MWNYSIIGIISFLILFNGTVFAQNMPHIHGTLSVLEYGHFEKCVSENEPQYLGKDDTLNVLLVFVAFKGFQYALHDWPDFDENDLFGQSANDIDFSFFENERWNYGLPRFVQMDSAGFLAGLEPFFSKQNALSVNNIIQESWENAPHVQAGTFLNTAGRPQLVQIDLNDYAGNEWQGLAGLALKEMEKLNPAFDFSLYDLFETDTCLKYTGQQKSDGRIDLTVFVFRYSHAWRSRFFAAPGEIMQEIHQWAGSETGILNKINDRENFRRTPLIATIPGNGFTMQSAFLQILGRSGYIKISDRDINRALDAFRPSDEFLEFFTPPPGDPETISPWEKANHR